MKYKLVHTCIRIMDLEKSLQFYTKGLGLVETRRKDFKEHKFTLVYVTDELRNFELELTYNYDTKVPYELGNGYSHLALVVEDLRASYNKHKEMGYTVTDIKGLPGDPDKFYFVKDPDGYSIEIIRED